MVCTANDLLEWKDFPKGLRVLVLDEDTDSANEIKSKLQDMEYMVSAFFSENEALSAISSRVHTFHVAIVEVSVHNSNGRYKFLEIAKDLPTIMTSSEQNLSTMMKCIALGAVEFMIKPLSEEKLRNIWQHVAHKAFNAIGRESQESLKSVKEYVGSVLEIQQQSTDEQKSQVSEEPKFSSLLNHNDYEPTTNVTDKFPAPSTPQLKHGERFLNDVDCQEQPHSSHVKEFVDATSADLAADMELDPRQPEDDVVVKVEDCHGEASKGTNDSSHKPHANEYDIHLSANNVYLNKESGPQNLSRPKGNKKKAKVDWTPNLHNKFVQAVEQLGFDQAIPSKILELMNVGGLTRHNIASHLQKYRMHRRHILPKNDHPRWSYPRSIYPHRPVMAFPPYQTNHMFPPGHSFPMWGPQTGQSPGFSMWGPPSYPSWQPVENWQWNLSYPGMHADAWGCPVPSTNFPHVQSSYGCQKLDHYGKNASNLHPGDEVIDEVVKEAINKPWLPLPIGLKPPSTESVLTELSRQGITVVPPRINGCHPC